MGRGSVAVLPPYSTNCEIVSLAGPRKLSNLSCKNV